MDELIRKLEKIDSGSVKEGISHHFIEIRENNNEVVFSANSQGFVWLALQALKLANKANEGSHVHVDEHGLADKANPPLVLAYKNAN